jgi:hypothetical protein
VAEHFLAITGPQGFSPAPKETKQNKKTTVKKKEMNLGKRFVETLYYS